MSAVRERRFRGPICARGELRCCAAVNEAYLTPVGFEPTQLALVELESTPLDHSGKLSWGATAPVPAAGVRAPAHSNLLVGASTNGPVA